MPSTLSVAPSTIVCRLAAGDLQDANPAQVNALLGVAVGPSGATDNALARFDTATGKLLKDSPNSTLGDSGHLILLGSAVAIDMLERATPPAFQAGRGHFWVRDDTPSVPIFTDDLGNDLPMLTNEANVTLALNGATPGVVLPETADNFLIQDNSDSDNLKLATIQSVIDLVPSSAKNLIINGNFNIWQRGFTFTGAANIYTADRWAFRSVGTGVVDVTRSTDVPNGFSEYSLQVEVTTADAALATTDFYGLEYRVEGLDTIPLGFGAAGPQSITISFWVKSAVTGIHSVAIQNSAIDLSYVGEYTVGVADTWEQKSITIPGAATGTWLKDTGIGLAVLFPMASGPDRDTTPGSYQAGDFKASNNQVNVMGTIANQFKVSQVQIEVGTAVSAFVHLPFAQELALAKRYFQKTFPYAVAPASNAGAEGSLQYQVISAGASQNYKFVWQLPVQLRVEPVTQTFYNPSAAGSNWYNSTDAGNSGGSAAQGVTNDSRILINNAQVATDGVNDICNLHATVESEL